MELDATFLTRLGIGLEIIAFPLLAPEILGEERLKSFQAFLRGSDSEDFPQRRKTCSCCLMAALMVALPMVVVPLHLFFGLLPLRLVVILSLPFLVMVGLVVIALTFRNASNSTRFAWLRTPLLLLSIPFFIAILGQYGLSLLISAPIAIAQRGAVRQLVFGLGATLLFAGLALQLAATY